MKLLRILARNFEKVSSFLPNEMVIKLLSSSRVKFMSKFSSQKLDIMYIPDSHLERTLWGIKFRSPLMNSAGMFKNGEAYDVVANLGAGAYIGGTSTFNPRSGNVVNDIKLPFVTLAHSKTSINYLGLPNLGDEVLASIHFNKVDGCPVGWSVMRSPDYPEDEGMKKLIQSLWMYHDNLAIDFIEINESCPNIKSDSSNIISRLITIANEFLKHRKRHLPVVVKLSNDIPFNVLKDILDILFKYKFDGVNLGNTSTDYKQIINKLELVDKKLFNYFTTTFGGGVSGRILKKQSFELCKFANDYKNKIKPAHEFHIIRSGGIDSYDDILDSNKIGVSLNQWYTGFFTQYLANGNLIYQNLFRKS